jgi:hypothetical protein
MPGGHCGKNPDKEQKFHHDLGVPVFDKLRTNLSAWKVGDLGG